MYKRAILATTILLLTILLASAASGGGSRGFDGKWVLDKNASNIASIPVPDGLQQRMKTSGNTIVIESVFKEPANGITPLLYLGLMMSTMQLGADGSETVNQVGPFMQTS